MGSNTVELPDTAIVLMQIPESYEGPLPGPPGLVGWIGGQFRRKIERKNGWFEVWATKAEWREVLEWWKAINNEETNAD